MKTPFEEIFGTPADPEADRIQDAKKQRGEQIQAAMTPEHWELYDGTGHYHVWLPDRQCLAHCPMCEALGIHQEVSK